MNSPLENQQARKKTCQEKLNPFLRPTKVASRGFASTVFSFPPVPTIAPAPPNPRGRSTGSVGTFNPTLFPRPDASPGFVLSQPLFVFEKARDVGLLFFVVHPEGNDDERGVMALAFRSTGVTVMFHVSFGTLGRYRGAAAMHTPFETPMLEAQSTYTTFRRASSRLVLYSPSSCLRRSKFLSCVWHVQFRIPSTSPLPPYSPQKIFARSNFLEFLSLSEPTS